MVCPRNRLLVKQMARTATTLILLSSLVVSLRSVPTATSFFMKVLSKPRLEDSHRSRAGLGSSSAGCSDSGKQVPRPFSNGSHYLFSFSLFFVFVFIDKLYTRTDFNRAGKLLVRDENDA